jgi:hypothetical protein
MAIQTQTTPPSLPSGNTQSHLTPVPDSILTLEVSDTATWTTAATVYADPLLGSSRRRPRNKAAHSSTRRARADLEKAEFRIMFVLWPALVGISLAL